MKLSTIKFFCIFIVAWLMLACFSLPAATVDDLIDSGNRLMDANEHEQALTYFERVIESDPNNERALAYASRSLQQINEKERAFQYYNRLAQWDPEEFEYFRPRELYRFSAILAYQVGKYQRALELFDRALNQTEDQTEKDQLLSWRQRASSAHSREPGEARQKALEEVILSADRLLQENRAEEALRLLKNNQTDFEELSRFQEKFEHLEKIVDFKNWQDEVRQIDKQVEKDRLTELIQTGRNYYNKDEFQEETKTYLSRLLFFRAQRSVQNNNYEDAREYLLAVFSLEKEPPPEAYQELIRTFYFLNDLDNAFNQWRELNRVYPDFDLDSYLQWQLWLRRIGYWLGLVILLVAGFALVFFVFVPYFGFQILTLIGSKLADFFRVSGEKSMVLFVYNMFCSPVKISESHFQRWIKLLKSEGEENKLMKVLHRRDEKLDLSPGARVEFGRLLNKEGESDRAIRQFKKAAQNWEQLTKKQKIKTAGYLGDMYMKKNSPEEALVWLKRARDETPQNEQINSKILQLSARLDRWDEWNKNGEVWLEKIRSGYVQQTQRRGLTTETEKEKLKDPRSISRFLLEIYDKQREVELADESTEIIEFLYNCTEDLTDVDFQKQLLEELVEREDLSREKERDYLDELGDLLANREKAEEAIKYYRRLLEIDPEEFVVLEKIGRLYLKIDAREEALQCFEKVFEFEKDNPRAARGLQQIGRRYEEDDNYKQAARAYRLILDNSYFVKAEIQFRYGITLYRLGRVEDAVSVFQKIEQGDEVFRARVLVFIAQCLNEMNSPGAALSRLREVDPNNQAFPPDLRRVLHYWQGRSLEAQGEISQALKHYREIMASNVEYRDVSERIDNIANRE